MNRSTADPIRITHIITGLATGGSEMMLYRLLSALDRQRFLPEVISLTEEGPLAQKLRALGVPVKALGMRPGFPDPRALARLAGWLRAARPALVQTWMYHADLVGGLAARWAGPPVVWGLHNNVLQPRSTKRTTLWTVKACARLSPWLPVKIISCSQAAAEAHARLGYRREKMVIIPNGFDLQAFKPDAAARAGVRAELGLPEDAPLIGLAARYDPIKDHRSFVEAAARLAQCFPDVHFLLCGEGVTWQNPELAGWIRQQGLQDSFHLLGRREDMPRLTAALDIAANSSIGEAFSNAIGEAMACGVPCAVTDVGDSALIVGETGRVVPPGDPQALAAAWQELLELSPPARAQLGLAARQRVEQHFSLAAIAARYADVYASVLAGAG